MVSFNQKIISCMTLLAVGITAAVTFVCFEPPYQMKFWVAFSALVFSQLLFGAFWVQQIGKADSVSPLSIGVWGLNLIYCIFALICTMLTGLDDNYFILVQVVGFSVFVIAHLFFRMVEHHVEELAKDDMPEQKIERAKVTWR